jgi:glycosyltransferase involved in cell wall biosynthesis
LVALVESTGHVCCRYRLAAYRGHWENAGHALTLQCLPHGTWAWLGLARLLASADAVILQRKLLAPWQLYIVRRASRMLIYDIDDAVFMRDSYSPKGLYSSRRQRRFASTVGCADLVVAGNGFLQSQIVRHTDPNRVYVIPTCVDPGAYRLAPHERRAPHMELVWLGSSSTLRGLEKVKPLLETLGARCPGVSLKIVCDRFFTLQNIQVTACPWSETTQADALASADVGISWLPDDLWSRGKCGLKVLQYMAAGLPVIANPVGMQTELVRPGATGFLADSADQWVEAVSRLAQSPSQRRKMGQAGRRRVALEFSIAQGAQAWLKTLESCPGRRLTA